MGRKGDDHRLSQLIFGPSSAKPERRQGQDDYDMKRRLVYSFLTPSFIQVITSVSSSTPPKSTHLLIMRFSSLPVATVVAFLGQTASCFLACKVLPDLPESISESPEALLLLQRETTAIGAQAYADKNLDTLLSYVADPYIQHNPLAPSGKAIAQVGMTQIFATPGLINNVTRVISDLDYVALHVHRIQPNTTDKAIVDIFRLNGTCITEHWDVQQTMIPSSTNPLAYF